MRFLIVFGFILFNACMAIPQSKNDMVKISSISVYQDFQERGYTTAGAFTHFDDMKKEGIETIRIAGEDIKRLEQILNTAKQLKHFQRKLAGGLIFCNLTFDENHSESRVVIGIGTDVSGIMDLTNRIDYKITNPEDLKWLSDFTERMKKVESK